MWTFIRSSEHLFNILCIIRSSFSYISDNLVFIFLYKCPSDLNGTQTTQVCEINWAMRQSGGYMFNYVLGCIHMFVVHSINRGSGEIARLRMRDAQLSLFEFLLVKLNFFRPTLITTLIQVQACPTGIWEYLLQILVEYATNFLLHSRRRHHHHHHHLRRGRRQARAFVSFEVLRDFFG